MALNDFNFLFFLAVVFAFIVLLQICRNLFHLDDSHCIRVQNIILLASSLIFMAATDIRFLLCILVVTAISFCSARLIEKYKLYKKTVAAIGISVLLLILCYFKYTDFFIHSFCEAFQLQYTSLNIILPLGISFYIFSALSYIIDVYRDAYPSESDFCDFALFIAFFPKVISGPIARANEFLPQIKKYRLITFKNTSRGAWIFVYGLFKKIVIADHLSVFVNDVFAAPAQFNTLTVIYGIVAYSFQIYYDFSGYSDMAIGVSEILGIQIQRNFNMPYLARNLSEFWQRWHISLSSWLKDYLYIPMGGNKKGIVRTYINSFLVMLISGLWHGAGWTFIIWGALHGIMSCFDKLLKRGLKSVKERKNYSVLDIANIIFTYFVVAVFWVFFRASSVANALDVLKCAVTLHRGINQPYAWLWFAVVIWFISVVYSFIKTKRSCDEVYVILDLHSFWNLVIFFTFIGITIIMGYYGNTAFIYGKF